MTTGPTPSIRSLSRALRLACVVALVAPGSVAAQQQSNSHALAPANARVLLLPASMYNAQANLQEPTDSAKAAIATATLDSVLGQVVLDDSTELKGEPDRMVRIGTRIFAERVARTVRAGGVVNNFPNGVPAGA